MPELPEIETVKRGLADYITNQTITNVDQRWAKTLRASPAQIKQHIMGHTIEQLRRRGKVLIWDLDNGYSLLFHLKMTGQIVLEYAGSSTGTGSTENEEQGVRSPEHGGRKQEDGTRETQDSKPKVQNPADTTRFAGGHPTKSLEADLPDKSTRVIFGLKDGSKLYFNDQRKFGWIKLVPTKEVNQDKLLSRLGPEPLGYHFDVEEFVTAVKRRKASIKAVLLDQDAVAGVGNIYADEALHKAKIHPRKKAHRVSKSKLKDLHQAIIDVMKDSLQYGGTTFTNYVNHLGKQGDYLEHARVFRREGEPCPVCGTPIKKIKVAGRGTHVCPKCQKM